MTLFNHACRATLLALLLLTSFSTSVFAQAPQLTNPVPVELSAIPIASGNFVQRKYFTVLKQPIKSQGELYFDVDLGLLWQTNKPLYSALLMTKNRLFTEDDRGARQEIQGASAISQLLLNIMSGDSEQIAENFTLADDTLSENACLSLTPKLTQLAKVIKTVQLCHRDSEASENNINRIVLFEHSGNRTEMDVQLTALKTLPEAVRARLQ